MPRKRSAQRGQQVPEEISELHVTAEELAQMHPLIRLAIEALHRDAVEIKTHYDRQGNVASVRTRRRKSPARARTFHSLLNVVLPLMERGEMRAPKRAPYDLEGTVNSAATTPAATAPKPRRRAIITPPIWALYQYFYVVIVTTIRNGKADPQNMKPKVLSASIHRGSST